LGKAPVIPRAALTKASITRMGDNADRLPGGGDWKPLTSAFTGDIPGDMSCSWPIGDWDTAIAVVSSAAM